MAEGYEDIDKYVANYNQMLDQSLQQQNDIVNKQTQMQVDSLGRQKEQIDREATQQNRAIYQDYKKNSNPFGQQAENLAGQGLANSGYAETTQARMYNTYQNNITATLNNARQLKADVDFQIQQARQTGDITLAQNALQLYNQRMQLLSQEYDMRNNREQFLYQKKQDALAQRNWQTEFDYNRSVADRNYNYQISRDKVSDEQWLKNYNYQKNRDKVSDKQWNKTFNYQKSRDKVSDTHWEKEYALSKKAKASSSRSSGSSRRSYSRKSSSGSTSNSINIDDDKNVTNNKKDNSNTIKNILQTVDGMLKKTKTGKLAQAVAKTGARQYIFRAVENEMISDKDAETLYNKLGLEK